MAGALEGAVERVRWIGRVGLGLSLLTLAVGGLMVAAAAVMAGNWWLARQPLIGLGLDVLVLGLALTAVLGVLRVIVEPIGWLRILAILPALAVSVLWWAWFVFGVPTTARCNACPRPSVGTILYSVPELIPVAILVTLAIPLPVAIAWFVRKRSMPAV